MSHFTVLVIGDDVEGQLAPYDENTEVEAYKAYWDTDTLERWTRILQGSEDEHQGIPENATIDQIAEAYNARYHDDGGEDRVFVDDGGIFEWSTYNPKSKWDWYSTGGRWRGYFLRKEGALAKVGAPGVFDNESRYGERGADVIQRKDVDVEGMQQPAMEEAGRLWDEVHAIIDPLPEMVGWRSLVGEALTAAGGDQSKVDMDSLREAYHSQPRVQAMKGREEFGPFGLTIEEFQVERDVFVNRAKNGVLCTYAYVKDGEWHAPGNMGWWGMSDDTENDRYRFAEEFNAMFEALPGDTWLTLVDCHI